MRDGAGMRGFTLLEVVVAFAIASLALAALSQAAAGGLRASRVAAHTEEALSRARSRLAAEALAPRPGERAGDDGGGFAWRVRVRQADAVASAPGARRPVLYAIGVDVSWGSDGGTRRVALETLRVGAGGAAGP